MSEWRIYRKNVNLSNVTDATAYVASVKVLEYRGTFLEDTQVSFDISSPTPISLAYGDKLSYRGETYVLRDPLAVEKVARRNSYGGAFKYENIVFRGLEWEMQNVEFTDVVPQDNNLHYTGLSTFSFYCDHPQKLIERVQACMDIAYTGTEAWTISLASGFDISQYSFTPQTISISSGTSCWAALGILYKNWKIPFTRSGKTITVGASVVVTSTVEYGNGNGLMSIKRVPDTDVRVITRLRAYGSQKNMPYRYYNKGFINEAMYMPYLMLPAVREHTAGDGHDVYLLSANVENYGIIDGEVHFDGSGDNEEIYPTLEGMTTTDAEITAVTYDSTDKRLDRILSAVNPADNGVCEDGNYDSDDAVDTDGVRIVKEFTMTIPYLGFDWKDNLTSEGQATIIMKSGMCAAREFTILEVNPVSASNPSQGSVLRMERINDDVTGYAYPNSTWTINAGDYFVIAGIEMDDVYVIAAENRLLTAASAFLAENDHPNYKYEPSIDNIWMQNHPTDAAKMRPGVKLSFSDTDLGISSGVVTIQTVTIDEGKRPLPEYQVVLNDNVTTTTLENLTAQVDAIMSGNAGVGGGMSQSELMAQIRNVGGTLFLSKNNTDTANGLITFLRGLTSQGQANLLGGAQFDANGAYTINNEGDAKLYDIWAHFIEATKVDAGTINAEVLNAKAAHFAQLIIDELRSAGGAYLLSAADCTIDYVEKLNSSKNVITTGTTAYYRCYYKANDNERAIAQKFVAGDQVMHTTFDKADSGYHLTDNSNRYYWMIVDAVSSTPSEKTLQDGVVYPCHWIDINPSIAARNSNATPEVDDNIVLLGHQGNDTARQSAIYITAYSNSFDTEVQPPAIVFYQNINSFDLSAANGKKPNYWGRDKVVVTGQLFYTSSGSGSGTDVSTLVGADNYSFWLDKSYQQYSGSGNLTYKVKMSKNGKQQSVTEVGSRLSLSSLSGCTLVSLSTHGDLIITPTASDGNAVINCYTSDTTHDNTTLWGQITASFGSSANAIDQFLFWLDKPYQQYSGSGTLTYNINLSVNGVDTNPSAYLGTPTNTNCTSSITGKVLTVTPTEGATSGSVVVNCYTSNTTHSGSTMWGQLTASFATSADGVPQYVFYLEQDTKKVKCNGGSKTNPSLDQTSLTYNVSLKIDNELQSQNVVGDYISAGTGANCDVSVNSTTGVVTLTNLGKDDKTIGGSGTILCYTDTAKTKLWGVLTAKFNVSWSTFAFNIVDNELTSMADENVTNSLGYKIAQNRTSITQNVNSITAIAGGVDTSEVNLSTLKIQSDNISANVASQKYNSNLFGFTDGLSFVGSCVPFIQAYGVELVGNSVGTITGFGGKKVDGVTLSFDVRTVTGTTSLSVSIAGTNGSQSVSHSETLTDITTTWQRKTVTADDITALNSISASYSASGIETVVLRNIKIESGAIATTFCISDSDGTKIESDNLYTTTVDYDGNPQSNFSGSNEGLDKTNTDGHGTVMKFYRSNSSATWLFYDGTSERKTLTAGNVYTLSFWAKAGTLPSGKPSIRIQSGFYLQLPNDDVSWRAYNPSGTYQNLEEGLSNNGIFVQDLTTEWQRFYVRFYIKTGVTVTQVTQTNNNGIPLGVDSNVYFYIADVRLEEGYIADESDPMSISGAQTRSEAKFNLTADNIELKLNNTGINIENNLITLDANKTIVNGELQAGKVLTSNKGYGYIDMTDGLMKVFNPNGVNQIVFGVDSSGNIILQYLDKDTGRILWDLGPTGMSTSKSQDERVVTYTWCMMKDWNSSNNTWEQVGLDAYDTDVNALDNYYRQIQNGASMSYLAYLIKNGIANGNGTVYQYEAKINGGQYIGTAMSNNSATVAEVYDKLFLQRQPSSSSPLAVSGGGAASSSWYAGFIRIKRFEIWRTYDMGATITQSDGKSYVIPSGYVDGVNGDMVDFSVDTANGTYNDPPVCFLAQSYEYGVLKEDIPYYINYSKIEGL